ncbi:hypothetical protein SZ64_07110 [Erythrobacter sp. SG61-1L]|nr:hypothetical protein SZ64_07110 [Erythrobacter sp. SG61-1L]
MLVAQPALTQDIPPIEAYGELPSVETAAISASGERIAIVTTYGHERLLLIVDSSMNLLRQVRVQDAKLRDLEWVGDEAVLVVTSETEDLPIGYTTDSYEAFSAITVPVDSKKEIQVVFAGNRGVVTSIFGNYGVRKVDGQWRGYFGGIQLARSLDLGFVLSGTDISLMEVDLLKNSARKAASPPSTDVSREWLVDAGGKVAARFDLQSDTGRWQLFGSGGKALASGLQPEGYAGLIGLSFDGKGVIYSVRKDGQTVWYERKLDGSGEPKEVFEDVGVRMTYFDRHSPRILGILPRGSGQKPEFFDPVWNERAQKVARAFSKFDFSIEGWNDTFTQVLVRTSGTGDSGTWYLVDIDQLRAEAIGRERPAIGSDQVGPVSVFAYKAQDGLEMDGILTVPPGREAKSLPVVVFPHGGPAGFDRAEFDWWAQAFASRGYAVFQPNFRGSTHREAAFRNAGYGEWGRKMQTDLSDGLASLANAGIVDPKRACIMGASYGGYAALAGVTVQNGLYRCAVSVAGVSDPRQMYNTEVRESGNSNVLREALKMELGSKSDLDQVSPRRLAGKADAPILLIHGRDDTVVAFEQSTKMADALKDAGKPYKFVQLAGEDHWLSRSETRKQMLAEALAFVQEHNPAN